MHAVDQRPDSSSSSDSSNAAVHEHQRRQAAGAAGGGGAHLGPSEGHRAAERAAVQGGGHHVLVKGARSGQRTGKVVQRGSRDAPPAWERLQASMSSARPGCCWGSHRGLLRRPFCCPRRPHLESDGHAVAAQEHTAAVGRARRRPLPPQHHAAQAGGVLVVDEVDQVASPPLHLPLAQEEGVGAAAGCGVGWWDWGLRRQRSESHIHTWAGRMGCLPLPYA